MIAHDNKKKDILLWCLWNKDILGRHELHGTATTAQLIYEETGLDVKAYKSGPMGGDLQIGVDIVNGITDILIFFWDPMAAQPHDPDVKALLRIAQVYDIPVATNRSTADYVISSVLMEDAQEIRQT